MEVLARVWKSEDFLSKRVKLTLFLNFRQYYVEEVFVG